MVARLLTAGAGLAALLGVGVDVAAQERTAGVDVNCKPMVDRMKLEGRASPYDSTVVTIDGQSAKICYGRPSARGRMMIGGEAVAYGKLWRTGANEPTTIHLPFAASMAGVAVEPGSYSIYTIPGEKEWGVILNRSITQWGHEGRYTPEVQGQEVGRGTVMSERLEDHVEMFTIRSEPGGRGKANFVLEWEHTRVRIPIEMKSKM